MDPENSIATKTTIEKFMLTSRMKNVILEETLRVST